VKTLIAVYLCLFGVALAPEDTTQSPHESVLSSTDGPNWKVAVCKHMVDVEFPHALPSTCNTGQALTPQNGGLFTVTVELACGETLNCTWACVTKKQRGQRFKVNHGPWWLCEPCFNELPQNCVQEPPRQKRGPERRSDANLREPFSQQREDYKISQRRANR
jgi:hypothetical protein